MYDAIAVKLIVLNKFNAIIKIIKIGLAGRVQNLYAVLAMSGREAGVWFVSECV